MSTPPTNSAAQPASRNATVPAISAQSLGKRYDIFSRNIDRVKQIVTRKRCCREFWALRDVSFEVMPGEAVGVVGRNGSGKSTLMQIIAGTLTPSEGSATIRGRIAALLELGSGFNPAFTGRENIFLAGAIMGFSRREMEQRFDDIAAFADIGDFLEQPIEVYSSGMHARLAFAVAINVRPDILIIDEILAVGDAAFQQRCIGRLKQMMDTGVTLLFVSHSAEAVKSLCSRGLFLESGRRKFFGAAVDAVDAYAASLRKAVTDTAVQNAAFRRPALAQAPEPETPGVSTAGSPSGTASASTELKPPGDRGGEQRDDDDLVETQNTSVPPEATRPQGTGHARITAVRLLDEQGNLIDCVSLRQKVTIEADVVALVPIDRMDLLMTVRDKVGVTLFGSTCWDNTRRTQALAPGERLTFRFSFVSPLAPGPHGVNLTLTRRPDQRGEGLITLHHIDTAAAFVSLQVPPLPPPGPTGIARGKLLVPVTAEVVRHPQVAEIQL